MVGDRQPLPELSDEDMDELIEDEREELIESVGKRIGVPFDYSFLNELQVKVIDENEQTKKSFSSFIGEMYGV